MMDIQLLEEIKRDTLSTDRYKKTVAMTGASAEQIAGAQEELGIQFPPSYVAFLREFNGGEFRYLRMMRIGENEMNERSQAETGDGLLEYYGDLVDYVTSGDRFYNTWKRPADEEEAGKYTNPFWEGIYARRYFPFADNHGGSYYCFDLTTSHGGEYPVLYWEHEIWAEPPTYRAGNLAELLAQVYSDED